MNMLDVPRRLAGAALGPWFYQPRVDARGRIAPLKPVLGPINQWLMEQGANPPWIMTPQQCHAFWSRLSSETASINAPSRYAAKSPALIHFLHRFWTPHVRPGDRIVELGCNSGSNLEQLRRLGYADLRGIDINPHALAYANDAFPKLAARGALTCASLEDWLPKADSASVDVVLTVAVLIHVHPASRGIFQEMVRIARRYVCVVESEAASCSYLFARNLQRVFERLGCVQVSSVFLTPESAPEMDRQYDGYTARLFRVPDSRSVSHHATEHWQE